MMRNFKRLNVSGAGFVMLLLNMDGKTLLVCHGLPADAKVVGTFTDSARDMVTYIIESATFDHVPEGELIPELDPPEITRAASA